MLDRLTDAARRAVACAGDEARALGHRAVGSEHLLLGLLCEEEGRAAHALGRLHVTGEQVRAGVAGQRSAGAAPVSGQVPFTRAGREVLSCALAEAVKLGHDGVGTEHLLLALASDHGGVAAGILRDLGAGGEAIRRTIMREIALGRARATIHDQLDRMAASQTPIPRSRAHRLVRDALRRHDPRAEAALGPAAWEAMVQEILDADPDVAPLGS